VKRDTQDWPMRHLVVILPRGEETSPRCEVAKQARKDWATGAYVWSQAEYVIYNCRGGDDQHVALLRDGLTALLKDGAELERLYPTGTRAPEVESE
jgi:hypothetical protein